MEIVFLKIVVATLGALPIRLRSATGAVLGWFFSWLPTHERAIARLQLDLFLSERGGRRHLPLVYANLGQSLFETFNLKPMIKKIDRYVSCDNPAELQRLLAPDRGAVALTAHTGNWDLLAAYLLTKGVPLCTVGKEMARRSWQALLEAVRASYGIETIWRTDRAGLREIVRLLRKHRVIGALIDQDTNVSSIFTPFLGRPVKSPVSLVSLAKREQANIFCIFIYRVALSRYRVTISEIDNRLSEVDILTEYHCRLAEHIEAHPSQWVWFHKRWRTLVDGTRLSTRSYPAYLRSEITGRTTVQGTPD